MLESQRALDMSRIPSVEWRPVIWPKILAELDVWYWSKMVNESGHHYGRPSLSQVADYVTNRVLAELRGELLKGVEG